MNSIKSVNYHLWMFTYLMFSIGCLLVVSYFSLQQNISTKDTRLFAIVIPLNVLLIALIIRKVVRIPSVILSNIGIAIESKKNKRQIKWTEITNVDFFGRNGTFRMEAIKIETKLRRKPFLIYYSHYSNSNRIAQAIEFLYESTKNNDSFNLASFVPLTISSVQANKCRFENFQYISRIPLVSFRSYFPLIGVVLIYLGVTEGNNPKGLVVTGIVISIYMSAFLTFLIGFIGMSRIGISNELLRIENYYFSYGKTYQLNDIKEIFIEHPGGKAPNAIRIIFCDCTSKTFSVANFLKKDWLDLSNKLKQKKIILINNLYETNRTQQN